ncbi:putative membrane protein [Pseudomonas graminis]|uniref:multidrug/biocide efflux PACE transporter n=1 Tax=Pseudomonas graminis TaxID=158627 RepID=UPI00105E2C3F|nr:multidrug/biocide efflux PACE transporter [Pseudomonas graminis]TDV43335.1 putative membrane protein [Pseudomonas graminis]
MPLHTLTPHKTAKPVVATKSLRERAFHALLFELIGVLMFAPGLAWVLGQSIGKMGAMTVMISTVAMLWNMVFNAGVDRLRARLGFALTLKARALHAVGFEGGLVFLVVPMVAWWLSVTLLEAFLLDIGLVLLYLPYTMLFNLAYDGVRERMLARPQPCAADR